MSHPLAGVDSRDPITDSLAILRVGYATSMSQHVAPRLVFNKTPLDVCAER